MLKFLTGRRQFLYCRAAQLKRSFSHLQRKLNVFWFYWQQAFKALNLFGPVKGFRLWQNSYTLFYSKACTIRKGQSPEPPWQPWHLKVSLCDCCEQSVLQSWIYLWLFQCLGVLGNCSGLFFLFPEIPLRVNGRLRLFCEYNLPKCQAYFESVIFT